MTQVSHDAPEVIYFILCRLKSIQISIRWRPDQSRVLTANPLPAFKKLVLTAGISMSQTGKLS